MKNPCLTCPKRAHSPAGRGRDSSDQRHGFWWAVEKPGLAAGDRDHFGGNDVQSHKVSWRGIGNVRKRSGQRMQRTALVVKIKEAGQVIGVGICDGGM